MDGRAEGEKELELRCAGLRLHLPLYLHTVVSLHPLSRRAPVHEGRPQPPPPLWAVVLTWHLLWVPRFSWEL